MLDFLHTFHPEPILFSPGTINLYWYGLFVVAGIIAAILVARGLAKAYGLESEMMLDLSFWLIVFGVIGARIYDVLLTLPYYLANPLAIIKVWQGGLAIHGAIIAGLTTLYFFAKKRRADFWQLGSIVVPGLALALSIGRWGNYFNQELFGLPTNLVWGIPIDLANRPAGYENFTYFHPTFLYESVGSLIIFMCLILIHGTITKRFKNAPKFPISNFQFPILFFLISYSLLRFFLEFIKIDPTPIFLGLRWPQIVSIGLILISVIGLIILNKRRAPALNN